MAKAKEPAPEVAEEPPKGKGKKKLIIILAAVLLFLVVGGGAAVLLLTKPAGKHANQQAAQEDNNPPIYEGLESFTVNLADGQSYLQVEIKLLVANTDIEGKLKERMPEVRNDILRLLSSKMPDELSTPEGKDKLAADIKADINGLLRVKADNGVKKVLFGAFLIQ
jgi:flagellar FliL protein